MNKDIKIFQAHILSVLTVGNHMFTILTHPGNNKAQLSHAPLDENMTQYTLMHMMSNGEITLEEFGSRIPKTPEGVAFMLTIMSIIVEQDNEREHQERLNSILKKMDINDNTEES